MKLFNLIRITTALVILVSLLALSPIQSAQTEESVKSAAPKLVDCGTVSKVWQCVEQFHLRVQLIGDGETTSTCKLVLTNPKTGKSTSATLHTVCASRKSTKAPPNEETSKNKNLQWKVTDTPPGNVLALINNAKMLNALNVFRSVPLPPARKGSTVMQLAVWKTVAGANPDPKDAITPDTVEGDLLKKAHIKPDDLCADEKKQVRSRVDAIMDAVDLTCKIAEQVPPAKPQQPKEPKVPDNTAQSTVPDKHDNVCCIPVGTTFIPNDDGYQTMTCVEDAVIECAMDDPGITGGHVYQIDDKKPGDDKIEDKPVIDPLTGNTVERAHQTWCGQEWTGENVTDKDGNMVSGTVRIFNPSDHSMYEIEQKYKPGQKKGTQDPLREKATTTWRKWEVDPSGEQRLTEEKVRTTEYGDDGKNAVKETEELKKYSEDGKLTHTKTTHDYKTGETKSETLNPKTGKWE